MTKAILFDADGMIIHGKRFSDLLARDYGIPTDVTISFFKNEFQQCLVGKADLKKELSKIIDEWGWKDGTEALLDVWFKEENNKIDERFASIIKDLQANGIKTYLATNNEKYRTKNLVKDRGLGEWFDAIYSSGYMGSKKSEAAFFEHIIKDTGYTKENFLFWDDDPKNVDGATAFGLPTELYKDFEQFKNRVEPLLKQL